MLAMTAKAEAVFALAALGVLAVLEAAVAGSEFWAAMTVEAEAVFALAVLAVLAMLAAAVVRSEFWRLTANEVEQKILFQGAYPNTFSESSKSRRGCLLVCACACLYARW